MLERTDQPLSEDLPLMREVRSTLTKCLENGRDEVLSRLRQLRRQRHAVAVLRLLRPRFARPATGRPDRCGREHAARGAQPQVLSICRWTSARRVGQPEAGNPPAGIAGSLSAHQGNGAARFRESQPAAQECHRRAHALDRRLGRGDHRQEPGDDPVRTARLGHQGQSEIRFGEERPADHLLSVRRAGTDPHQLRIHLRRRRAVARPASVRPLPTRCPA